MTALSETVDILAARHAGVVAAYLIGNDAQQEELAREVLRRLGVDAAGATLTAAQEEQARLGLDVVVWRYVEAQAALLFDFSADGGSFQRSQLAASAARMRRMAEDAAEWAELAGFGYPPVVVGRLVKREPTGDESEWV